MRAIIELGSSGAVFLESNKIVSPISDERPCGVDIRYDPDHKELYYEIKDARNSARSLERNIVPGEPLRLAPEWRDVNAIGIRIISDISKDIEVLAWVAEAQTRINEFAGLRDTFAASAVLFEEYWDEIHSVSNEIIEDKVAPLAGLNGVSGEGTLIQAIRLTPLVPGAGFARHTLWDYQLAQRSSEEERREALHEAMSEVGIAAMADHLTTVTECIAAYDKLVAVLEARCGEHAPPSTNTRNVLLEAATAIRVLAGLSDDTPSPIIDEEDTNNRFAEEHKSAKLQAIQQGVAEVSAIGSREEAFEIMLAVARYFRRTEPHSPISMSIETLVRRGRMDFSELLAELLPEAQVRNAVLTAAGIQPKADE